MNYSMKVSNRFAMLAAVVLALTSLFAAYYHVKYLLPFLDEGERVTALVVDIHRGARNSKWAVYTFHTREGQSVTARDLFQMYFKRLHRGEEVPVLYLPSNPKIVTADLGAWNWQGPAIFLFGFIFLLTIGILILGYRKEQ